MTLPHDLGPEPQFPPDPRPAAAVGLSVDLREVSAHVLRHMGFRDYQTALLDKPLDHASWGCEFDGNHQGWECRDENGMSNHLMYDEMADAVEIVRVALEAPAIARHTQAAVTAALIEAAEAIEAAEVLGASTLNKHYRRAAAIVRDRIPTPP